jgi:hypothetical protein
MFFHLDVTGKGSFYLATDLWMKAALWETELVSGTGPWLLLPTLTAWLPLDLNKYSIQITASH